MLNWDGPRPPEDVPEPKWEGQRLNDREPGSTAAGVTQPYCLTRRLFYGSIFLGWTFLGNQMWRGFGM